MYLSEKIRHINGVLLYGRLEEKIQEGITNIKLSGKIHMKNGHCRSSLKYKHTYLKRHYPIFE